MLAGLKAEVVRTQSVFATTWVGGVDDVPLMPFRYAAAPRGQRQVSHEANIDTLILSLSTSFSEVRANPCSSTVYAFNSNLPRECDFTRVKAGVRGSGERCG